MPPANGMLQERVFYANFIRGSRYFFCVIYEIKCALEKPLENTE